MTHKNPVYRLAAPRIYHDHRDWILFKQPFRWLIKIDVIFSYPNGRDQHEQRELEGVATVNTLNEFCMTQIQDALRHGAEDRYRTTAFTVECLGC